MFFIVLCSNAVNFVDGLDGLATGVVGIGAVAFFAYSYFLTVNQDLTRATTSSLITVAIAGACLGFLPHNFFPARMFMGDSGAMLLGLLLATSTISLTGQIDTSQLADGTGGLVPTVLPLVLPIAILALPFLDLVLAFVRRTYAGRWWFVADKQHLHHRLLERGHSQRRAVVLMYIWSALVSFGVIVLGLVSNDRQWQVVAVVVVLALVLLLITVGRPVRGRRVAIARGVDRRIGKWALSRSAPRERMRKMPSTGAQRARAVQRRSMLGFADDATRQGRFWSTDDAAHDKGMVSLRCRSRTAAVSWIRAPRATGPSIHVVRARKLLFGGLVGGVAASVLSLVAFTLLYGTNGLISAALAAGMVLFFYVVGQLVMVMFADAGARTLLVVSMTSYTGRVVVLGLVLLFYSRYSDRWPTLQPMVIFFTTIAVVIGWLAVEIFVFSRLRIGIYDTEYTTPPNDDGPAVTRPVPAASVCSAMEQGRDSTSAEQPQKERTLGRRGPGDAGSVLPDRGGLPVRAARLAR